MAIQQMLLGAGGKTYGDVITLDGTTYDLSTIADASSPFKNVTGHYSLVVPAAGAKFKLMLWGAGGGDGVSSTETNGSAGGYAYGEFKLDAGTYTVIVGAHGLYNSSSINYPDGGGSPVYAAGGGGSTRFGPNVANNASDYNDTDFTYYLIAGGGGGGANYAAYNSTGTERGEGGGTNGGDGGWHYAAGEPASAIGLGGSQTAGGAGGTGGRMNDGAAGAKYSGGSGVGAGGGGGGGYYGGGAAAGYYAQGGGGSGYINTTVVSNGVLQGGGTFVSGGSYDEAYHGPNNEVPGASGDHEEDGAARFLYLS